MAKIIVSAILVLSISTGAWAQVIQPPTTRPAVAVVPSTAPAGGAPKFRCDQPVYEFPEVWSGAVVEATYVIHNDGNAVLDILQAKPTCGCTVAQYDKQIQPGSEGKITAKLNTRGYNHAVVKTISVRTNDTRNAQITLQIKGKVKARISMDPPSGAQFGQTMPMEDISRTVTLTNNTDKPFRPEHTPTQQPSPFSYELKEIQPGKVYAVTVTARKADIKEGGNFTQISLKTGIPEEPNFVVPANLHIPLLVQVNPPTIAVSTPVKGTFRREIVLTYNRNSPMKITSVSVNSPAIKVSAEQMPVLPQAPLQTRPAASQTRPALPQQIPGRSWKLVVDIPEGWEAPPATTGVQTQSSQIEITAVTDVKEKPEVKIRVFSDRQAAGGRSTKSTARR